MNTNKIDLIKAKVLEMVNSINPFIPDEDGKNSDYEAGRLDASIQILQIIDSLEEPVSEDLGEYINELSKQFPKVSFAKLSRIAVRVAKWQKEHNWKPADGDDLPDIDREVVVLIKYNAQRNIHDEEYPTYRVGFGHRPNPNGWDGKNIETNEVTHYTPKLYDKGGWNAPNIVYWLDARLPYEENKIDKEIEP